MPSYHCRYPNCSELLPTSGFCNNHKPVEVARKNSFYDRHQRNPEAKKFYDSAAWQRTRADVLSDHPTCQRCKNTWALHVHHVIPLDQCTESQKLDRSNLMALCVPCHNIITADEVAPETESKRRHVSGTIVVTEDDKYHYDNDKAERPIRFVEKYCRHFEGRFAGEPFRLLDWQKEIIRSLFGWTDRNTGLRRFRELYLISAKGAGKTPMLAAIGLYMLLGDCEAAPHVVSMASTFEQANLTFSAGKGYINESKALQSHARVLQYQIQDQKHGKWTTISGKPNGRSGPRPSCVIADERHEWPEPTAGAFELLCANLFKRSQPLLLVATNAGANRTSSAYQAHERACKVITGEIVDPTLLPVICECPPEVQWDTEAAARCANPSLGSIVAWDQLGPALARARESATAEAQYRRLYLSQWGTGSARQWLDLNKWDSVTGPLPDLTGLPCFVGIDLSQGDDLCAAISVFVGKDKFYIRSRFWLPKDTADKYQKTEGHPYREWQAQGAIDLINETTITPDVQNRIAQAIIDQHHRHPITAVAYDRYRADAVVNAIEQAGVVCIPTAQGYSVSSGCIELERRIIAGEIVIEPNPVLRSHAETVEVKSDERGHGNIWPVKPNARDKYKGRSGQKIDGISALVTALTEIQKRNIAPPKKEFSGKAWVI